MKLTNVSGRSPSKPSLTTLDLKGLGYGLLLLLGCVFAYTAYTHSAFSPWTFDDAPILSGLKQVEDYASAMDFIHSAPNISPTGRPLALASFLLNISDWPNHIAGFRHTNVLIHILNALLLCLISLRIANLVPALSKNAYAFAVCLSLLWLFQPILASTSFHVIQRMVSLAATFSLTGALLYLNGRASIENNPLKAYSLMSIGMLLPASLGILVKENAALTPLLIGTLEWTVLSVYSPIKQRFMIIWKSLFFGIPAIALTAYTAYYFYFHIDGAYLVRPYSLSERLLSESLILFEYICQIFIPSISMMGPYQDDSSRILGANGITIISLLLWAVLITTAIKYRQRKPAYSFAALFFFVGHLLESTVFPLELYFEHRNYLPAIGILGALTGTAWASKHAWVKIIFVIYLLFPAYQLWQLHTLWGNTLISAITTAKTHPTSTRAIQNLARTYQAIGREDLAIQSLIEGHQKMPYSSGIASYLLVFQCTSNNLPDSNDIVASILSSSPTFYFSRKVAGDVHNIINHISQDSCPGLKADSLIFFINGILQNPAFSAPNQRYVFYWALARTLDIKNMPKKALQAKIKAIQEKPLFDDIRGIYMELKRDFTEEEARAFIHELQILVPEFSKRYNELLQLEGND